MEVGTVFAFAWALAIANVYGCFGLWYFRFRQDQRVILMLWTITNWTVNMFLECERRNFVIQTQTRIWLEEVLRTRLNEHRSIADLLADGELLFEVSKEVLSKRSELKGYDYEPLASRNGGRYMPYSFVDSFLKVYMANDSVNDGANSISKV